eukprot:TRINITY_DN15508_c0_g1_i1.p1 TRINITY_DN15508_c0_g1~~TRINITY_DN15508_c0_g1_i1.p1  ORF type:complete len:700 (-),score=119.10 TRINITY_DN15508_c0_g1_i1:88-2187(-)
MSSGTSAVSTEDGVATMVEQLDDLPMSNVATPAEISGEANHGSIANGALIANGNGEAASAKKGRGRGKRGRSTDSLLQEAQNLNASLNPRPRETRRRKVSNSKASAAPSQPQKKDFANVATVLNLLQDHPAEARELLNLSKQENDDDDDDNDDDEEYEEGEGSASTEISKEEGDASTKTNGAATNNDEANGEKEEQEANGEQELKKAKQGNKKRQLAWSVDMPIHGLSSWRAIIEKTLEKEGKTDNLYYATDKERWEEGTYINCDVRYLNMSALGKFDVVLIDPPWRIRGNEVASNDKTMFNNSKFALEYNTLSNQEVIDINVGCLSDNGFLFLWVINSQLQFAFECMNKWGYTYADKITWVKKTKNNNISIAQGYYFLHSTEMCLVGVKGKCEFITKVSNDVIFAETREKSQKPDQMYQIIERMCPGSRKIEIFARNHNLRRGWLSLGNELGEYYDWDRDQVDCDVCANTIQMGKTRYKSKLVANRDLCEDCLKKSGEPLDDYFALENIADTMIFHQYYECNNCKTKPLWGIRFHCLDCDDCDLCEACYDSKIIPKDSKHELTHKIQPVEISELAGGLPVHRERCAGCLTFPIIGYRFKCHDCSYVSLCQKCFFHKKTPRNHHPDHDIELIIEPDESSSLPAKCDVCAMKPIIGTRYKCNSCYNYDLCEKCYISKAPPPLNDISHRPNHRFTRIPARS